MGYSYPKKALRLLVLCTVREALKKPKESLKVLFQIVLLERVVFRRSSSVKELKVSDDLNVFT